MIRFHIKTIEKICIFIYFLLVILGIKKFVVWEQITIILDSVEHWGYFDLLLDLQKNNHPHFLRVLLMVPIYFLSRLFSLDVNLLFSFLAVCMLYFSYCLIYKIVEKKICRVLFFPNLLFFLFLSFLMNGRSVFVFFANTIAMYILFRIKSFNKVVVAFLFLIGTLLSSVSSGTIFVYLGTYLTFICFFILPKFFKGNIDLKKMLVLVFSILTPIAILFDTLIIFINKNLNYYNGSFVEMLNHGFGGIILNNFILAFVLLCFTFLPFILIYRFMKYELVNYPFHISLVISSLFIGLFGYLSLVSSLFAIISLSYCLSINIFNARRVGNLRC